jgi:hypothetical protein
MSSSKRGTYVVTQRDVQEDRRKPDSIAMGSHFIDTHHTLALQEDSQANSDVADTRRVAW